MKWFETLLTRKAKCHENATTSGHELARIAIEWMTTNPDVPLEFMAKEAAPFASAIVRRALAKNGWRARHIDVFFDSFLAGLVAGGVPHERAEAIAAVARQNTQNDIKLNLPLPRTKLSDYMDGRDTKRWDFSANAHGNDGEEITLFGLLEELLSETEFALSGPSGWDLPDKRSVAAHLRRLVIDMASQSDATAILHDKDMELRRKGDVNHYAYYLARLLLRASDAVQPARREDVDSIALTTLLLQGKPGGMLKGKRLAPCALVILQQIWIKRFLAENGEHVWSASVVFPEEFQRSLEKR